MCIRDSHGEHEDTAVRSHQAAAEEHAQSAGHRALSMFFGCSLMAPHGGIFVFPVVTNVLGYVISLVVGSLVGMLLLGVLKKNKEQ